MFHTIGQCDMQYVVARLRSWRQECKTLWFASNKVGEQHVQYGIAKLVCCNAACGICDTANSY